MRKTWREKLHNGRDPVVVTLRKASGGVPAGSRMLIPTPLQVRDYIERIPPGVRVSVATLRSDLARDSQADATCPLCTGMFLRIVAEAALETPNDRLTPFWRIIDPDSPTAKKLSCGPGFISLQRETESNFMAEVPAPTRSKRAAQEPRP